eukprot:13802745-Alexandrium_andersonii.AAC.1
MPRVLGPPTRAESLSWNRAHMYADQEPAPVQHRPRKSRTRSPARRGRTGSPLPPSQRVSLSSSDDESAPGPRTAGKEEPPKPRTEEQEPSRGRSPSRRET